MPRRRMMAWLNNEQLRAGRSICCCCVIRLLLLFFSIPLDGSTPGAPGRRGRTSAGDKTKSWLGTWPHDACGTPHTHTCMGRDQVGARRAISPSDGRAKKPC